MRIAYFLTEYPSHSQTFVDDQIRRLSESGHEITVFADRPGTGEAPSSKAVTLVPLRSTPRGSRSTRVSRLLDLRGMHRLPIRTNLRAFNPWAYGREALTLRIASAVASLGPEPRHFDVNIAHFGPNGVLASFLRDAGLLRGPLVVFFHGYDLSMYLRRRGSRTSYRRMLERIELALPISQRWKGRLLELGASERHTTVHHVGVDTSSIAFEPRQRDRGETRLITVARLTEKKGVEFAIRSLALLPAELDVHLDIVGDGPLRPELEALSNRLGLRSRVHFLGWRTSTEVLDLLTRSDVLVAPSVTAANGDEEGIPVVLMEAMAAGVPVVSTQHSGIPELVEDGTTGRLVPERNPTQLAEAILLSVTDEATTRRMTQQARTRVVADFDASTQADQLILLLESVHGQSSHG